MHIHFIDQHTSYMVHLVDIKFGEFICDVNWWVFSLATRSCMSVDSAYI